MDATPAFLDEVARVYELSQEERARLEAQRLLILDRWAATWIGGYREVYRNDLPVLITADSLLFPLHRLFLDVVPAHEMGVLLPKLVAALEAMDRAWTPRPELGGADADVALYLCVALALARQQDDGAYNGTCRPEVAEEAEPILSSLREGWLDFDEQWEGSGPVGAPFTVSLQGRERPLDPAIFVATGPYVYPDGQRWYRALTWLREGGFVLGEPTPKGGSTAHRRAALGAALTTELLESSGAAPALTEIATWTARIYGPPDGADPDALRAWLGDRDAGALASTQGWERALTDDELGLVAVWSGLDATPDGYQRFSLLPSVVALDSLALVSLAPHGTRPSTAALLGALGNDRALAWAPADQRAAASGWDHDLDALPSSWWTSSVRERWLDAIRALGDARQGDLPAPWDTEAGARRVAMVQLLSYTWLRHDTRLMAPAPSEGGCSYPRVVVEPFPAFYEGLAGVATALRDALVGADPKLLAHLRQVEQTLLRLRDVAAQQREAAPLPEADLSWLRGALTFRPKDEYVGDALDGWYPQLYWPPPVTTLGDGIVNRERIAVDSFVRGPTEGFEGEVLHLGSGAIRPMIALVETCDGPTTVVGPVQEVYELWTPGMARLSDQAWEELIKPEWVKGSEGYEPVEPSPPPRPSWLEPLFGPPRPKPR